MNKIKIDFNLKFSHRNEIGMNLNNLYLNGNNEMSKLRIENNFKTKFFIHSQELVEYRIKCCLILKGIDRRAINSYVTMIQDKIQITSSSVACDNNEINNSSTIIVMRLLILAKIRN